VKVSSARCFWEKLLVALCHDDASSLFGRDLEVESYANLAGNVNYKPIGTTVSVGNRNHEDSHPRQCTALGATPVKIMKNVSFVVIFRRISLQEKFLPDLSWAQDPVWLLQKNPLFSSYHLSKTSLLCFSWRTGGKKRKQNDAYRLQNRCSADRPASGRLVGYTHKHKSSEGA